MICVLHGFGNGRGRRGRPIRTGRRDKPIISLPSVALRVAVVVGVAIVLLGIVLFRLWFLQILSGQEFVAQANDNRLESVKVVAARGPIVDRHGEVIVENRPGVAIGIRLMDVPDGELDAVVRRLAHLLPMRQAKIRATLMQRLKPGWPTGVPFEWGRVASGEVLSLELVVIKSDIGEKGRRRVVSYLLEHKRAFPGVEIRNDYLRAYPQGDLAAHILGYVGEISAENLKEQHFKGYSPSDMVGKAGLEWTYDEWLRGHDGSAKIEVDAMGRPKQTDPVPGGRLAEPGDTLVTTLDADVQAAAEESLRYGLQLAHLDGKVAANGAAAVVLDARNGEVLAMASYPSFSPDLWVGGISTKDYKALTKKSANNPLFNRAIQEQKAVGSTFKAVTAVAALEEGKVTPHETFFCNGGYIAPNTLDEHVFKCWSTDGHGSLSLVGAITQSCDVYFYNLGYRFYSSKGTELSDWAKRLGMGQPTGIDIPGEVAGRVPTWQWKQSWPGFKTEIDKIWKPGDSITLAVGQGYLEATPLQLAEVYAAVANGGTMVTPHVGLKITDAQGKLVRRLVPTRPNRVDISRSTLDLVRQGLYEAANSSSGTSGSVFAGYKVPVAGKTGTAEVWDSDVMANIDYAWYASYAPANDPKYVVVVMIEKGGHGGTVAAPAARMIYDSLFDVDSGRFTGPVRSD